jgi:hypothetical protein
MQMGMEVPPVYQGFGKYASSRPIFGSLNTLQALVIGSALSSRKAFPNLEGRLLISIHLPLLPEPIILHAECMCSVLVVIMGHLGLHLTPFSRARTQRCKILPAAYRPLYIIPLLKISFLVYLP